MKKDYTKIPCTRIYKTKAYDELENFCDDDLGGDSCAMLSDIYDRQQVVNLLIPIIRKEIKQKGTKYTMKKKPIIKQMHGYVQWGDLQIPNKEFLEWNKKRIKELLKDQEEDHQIAG